MKKVVLDASVLSAFANTRRLKLLKKILSKHEVYIPDTVYEEIIHPQIRMETSFEYTGRSKRKWIHVVKVDTWKNHSTLDKGEQGVVQLAQKLNAVAVVDDKDARNYARKHGITHTGTLAILKRAREKKLITKTELKKIVEDLKTKDQFRMTDELERWLLE